MYQGTSVHSGEKTGWRSLEAEPAIRVGIVSGPTIRFSTPAGVVREVGRAEVDAAGGELRPALGATKPGEAAFELTDVAIGIGFHWERREAQRFEGSLLLRSSDDNDTDIIAINEIGVEAYLRSVVCSEMKADAPEEFLKAHAITSRSWLLRQLADAGKHPQGRCAFIRETDVDGQTIDELTCWHDREDHTQFDVCADDHCQRYQGVSRRTSSAVARAVDATRGIVLTYGDNICDARFSKCCGGRTERFEACWEEASHPYLEAIDDPYCLRATPDVLSTVLNSYDREQPGFAEWAERIPADELSALIARKSGIDFGQLLELRPLSRGASGRITRLLVRGTLRSMVVGKELEIRRWLSPTHLRSSWMDIEGPSADGHFTFRGRGWGHGVGLCQIGAAVMGAEGRTSAEILAHYFPKANLTRLYQ